EISTFTNQYQHFFNKSFLVAPFLIIYFFFQNDAASDIPFSDWPKFQQKSSIDSQFGLRPGAMQDSKTTNFKTKPYNSDPQSSGSSHVANQCAGIEYSTPPRKPQNLPQQPFSD